METLTYFIENLYATEFGSEEYQLMENITIKSINYNGLTIAGNLLKEVVFQDIIFLDCIFFSTTLNNCLFINCQFLNCKFQFSTFSECNFESTGWENCIWGFTALKDSELICSRGKNNYSFESTATFTQPETLSLWEFLSLTA